ncbi:uncharacterized protein PRCAT00001359001 [Priceomyces carsonii]|uniref:uncharacterized protein n=1 Tax=Priceomyces carsonii TaxID=28549 RepID=UPI002EDB3396|nr:unnamed protein product [Priceomyces carsonii]
MSRIRKINRVILDQSAGEPIDEDDQENILKDIGAENNESYKHYTRILCCLYISEFILVLVFKHNKILNVFVNSSIAMSLVSVNQSIHLGRYQGSIEYCNWGLATSLVLYFFKARLNLSSSHCWLPLFNVMNASTVKRWHARTNGDIRQLGNLKYKYKSV